jgi:hypothetical protein
MRKLSLAFTPRFICYTMSILFTATLLLVIVAVPQATYIAGVPLVPFAGLSVLGTRDLSDRDRGSDGGPVVAHFGRQEPCECSIGRGAQEWAEFYGSVPVEQHELGARPPSQLTSTE